MRTDISQYLYHWVKADTEEFAIDILCKIIERRQLFGGDGFIKGKHKCICFTETPMNQFHREEHRYKKFGVRFEKNYILSRGGRPVIYQPNSCFGICALEQQFHCMFNRFNMTSLKRNYTV